MTSVLFVAITAAEVAAVEGLLPASGAGASRLGPEDLAGAADDAARFALLSAALRRRAATVVVVTSASPPSVAAAFAARAAGARLVLVAGDGWAAGDERAATTIARLADVVITTAASAAACLRAGACTERLLVAGDAVEALAALCAPSAAIPSERPLPSDADHSGRDLGDEELALLSQAVRSGTLNSTRGCFVSSFEQAFAARLGVEHAIACSSGSAAVHAAIAALRLAPGDEVLTTPITDMGALTPILYEGGMPVFADVDPQTLNVTAASFAARLTSRTRALIATHLFGRTCEMGPIRALAAERGLLLIEDSAQSFLAEDPAGLAGTLGEIGCFSLQQGKHMTTGEGGIVISDDDALARHLRLFVNKAWGYGEAQPDHGFPALNYRMTELQGAVAVAQLAKLDGVVAARRDVASAWNGALADLPGLTLPTEPHGGRHVYWKYAILVDPATIDGGAAALGARLRDRGIACAPRYIQKPAFECGLFRDWSAHALTQLVAGAGARGPNPEFRREDFPGCYEALSRVLVLPINERYAPADTARVADAIREAVTELAGAS